MCWNSFDQIYSGVIMCFGNVVSIILNLLGYDKLALIIQLKETGAETFIMFIYEKWNTISCSIPPNLKKKMQPIFQIHIII